MDSRVKVLAELDDSLRSIDNAVSNLSIEEKEVAKPIIKKLGLAAGEILHAQKLIKDLEQSDSQ